MQALEHDERPWGWYEVLFDSEYSKVKIISVAPQQRLSYQSHEKRQEQWILIKGKLTVVRDNVEYTLDTPGESFSIPRGHKHRAWNKTDEIVEFVEVQTGEYFGEDDIIRYEDDYERVELEHLKDGNYIGGLTMPEKNTNKLNRNE